MIVGRPMVSPGVTLWRHSFPRTSPILLNIYNFVHYTQVFTGSPQVCLGSPQISPISAVLFLQWSECYKSSNWRLEVDESGNISLEFVWTLVFPVLFMVSPNLLRVFPGLPSVSPGIPKLPQTHCFSGMNVYELTGDLSWDKSA